MNYIIYKVTNLKNNKIYIGKTCTTLERRKRKHYNESRYQDRWDLQSTHFHRALIKYSVNDWVWEIEDDTAQTEKRIIWKGNILH